MYQQFKKDIGEYMGINMKSSLIKASKALMLAAVCSTTMAQGVTDKDLTTRWNTLMGDFNMTPKYHGFCYLDPNGELKGPNPHRRVRLASTSKIITALMAVDKLGPDYQYTTKFYWNGKDLHIKGDLDPVMSMRKLFFLISQLNNVGITKIDKLTFDGNFRIFSKVETVALSEFKPNVKSTVKYLKDYFTVSEWNIIANLYKNFIKSTPKEIIDNLQIRTELDDIKLEVGSITHVKENPLKEADLKTYEMVSPKVAKYLKIMNVASNNYIADQVFEKIGGRKAYHKYIQNFIKEKFGDYTALRKEFDSKEHSTYFYTGSGLNVGNGANRVDNYSTCAIMVNLVKELDDKMTELQRGMQEVVAVPGTDKGTFKRRLNSKRLANSIMAKTGTLKHTSSLAGKVSTKEGGVYFGIFHQMRGWKGNAKMVQNQIVTDMVDAFGGPAKFDYKKEYFFPAEGTLR
jgi:D-alanyl-D-alanine carboxypeptidase/D-alanyl-D-alanine-endopeptidase (penicillin-binding protein 4)